MMFPRAHGQRGSAGQRALRLAAVAVAAVLIGGAVFLIAEPRTRASQADPRDQKQVARGKQAYGQYCASCHGANLEGQPNWRQRKPDGRLPAPPHDATGHTWHHPDQHLFEVTKNGVKPPLAPPGYQSDMPGFAENLSDADIWAIIAFIKSLWPQEIRDRQPSFERQRGAQ